MSYETDTSDGAEPEERMAEIDRQNREQIEEALSEERESGFRGTMETEEFDVEEVLEGL